MHTLDEATKAFYNTRYGIPLELLENARIQEFLYWVNRGEDPLANFYCKFADDIVDHALDLHFNKGDSMIDIIDYITSAP